jgi:hypothetical protein
MSSRRSAKEPVVIIPEPKDLSACILAVECLFEEIIDLLGYETARDLFRVFVKEPTPSQKGEIRNRQIVRDYYAMPKPNIAHLARVFAEENKALPRKEQYGPGGTDVSALWFHIHRQLKKRDKLGNRLRTKSRSNKP